MVVVVIVAVVSLPGEFLVVVAVVSLSGEFLVVVDDESLSGEFLVVVAVVSLPWEFLVVVDLSEEFLVVVAVVSLSGTRHFTTSTILYRQVIAVLTSEEDSSKSSAVLPFLFLADRLEYRARNIV